MSHRLTRQELHAKVWDLPVTKLAKSFGLSDVALHKICRKYDIPTPPPGYWTKKAFGKPIRVTPLPNAGDATSILIRETSASTEPATLANARASVFAAFEEEGESPAANPIVGRTLSRLRKAKANRDGLVCTGGAGLVRIAVRRESVERAADLLTVLIAGAEKAQLKLVKTDAGAAWQTAGQIIGFEVVETTDQVEHVATEKELAAVAQWRHEREETHRRHGYWRDWGEPKIPKWERHYGGRLMVRLEDVRLKTERSSWGEPIRRSFAETRLRQLEPAIPRILSTVAAMAAAKTSNATFQDRERAIASEQVKRWAEAERRRQHDERAAALLDTLMEERARADRQRAFNKALGETEPTGRARQLLEWSEARLDSLEQRLSGSVLEERLAAAELFETEDEHGGD